MLICVQEGLCNRIRAVLSYQRVAQEAGRLLVVAWPPNEYCDGPFLDLFNPLTGVRFCFEPAELPNGLQLRQEHLIFECHPTIKGTRQEARMYSQLTPLKGLLAEIERRKCACGAPNFVAAHVRRTDHWTAGITKEQQTSDESIARFFDAHPRDQIYLATDNLDTQRHFLSRFQRRVHLTTIERRTDLRQTELRDAVCDLFVCAAARVFAGSYGSSFSDTIMHLRHVHGSTHDQDEHILMGLQALSGVGVR